MGLNYQKAAARTRALTDNRLEELQTVERQPVPYSPPAKKRKRWSGQRRAVNKWGHEKGAFAHRHNLACSTCGDTKPAGWAVAKRGKDGQPYGYCVPCFTAWKKKQTSG